MNAIKFVYLYYTETNGEKHLIGCYPSKSKAIRQLDYVNHEYIPTSDGSKRIAQKTNIDSSQYWYVERHVLRD